MSRAPRVPKAHARLSIAVGIGVVAAALGRTRFDPTVVAIAAWNAAALYLLASDAWVILRSGATETRRRAASEDPGRRLLFTVVLVASSFAILANAVVVRRAHALPLFERSVLVALCVGAVIIAWLLTHAVFALRYAHLYYGSGDEGGLEFPGHRHPDDLDFAYFAFTLGMCFQVSDVSITSRAIRRTTLFHAILSFAFNSVVLALAFNLVFSLVSP